MKKAVFLDRDGTLNEDPGYLSEPERLKLLPGAKDALIRLRQAGYSLIVVSNQSGVGRGLIPAEALPKIHARLDELMDPARIDYYALCLHRPEECCECRKPKPKLILDAAEELGIELACSYMVGDRLADVAAGQAAGCKASILVRTGEGAKAEAEIALNGEAQLRPDFIAETLMLAVDWILGSENAGP